MLEIAPALERDERGKALTDLDDVGALGVAAKVLLVFLPGLRELPLALAGEAQILLRLGAAWVFRVLEQLGIEPDRQVVVLRAHRLHRLTGQLVEFGGRRQGAAGRTRGGRHRLDEFRLGAAGTGGEQYLDAGQARHRPHEVIHVAAEFEDQRAPRADTELEPDVAQRRSARRGDWQRLAIAVADGATGQRLQLDPQFGT